MKKRMIAAMAAIAMAGAIAACGGNVDAREYKAAAAAVSEDSAAAVTDVSEKTEAAQTEASASYTVSDGEDITISTAGTYTITGSAKNATIYVDAGDEDEVTIRLSNVSITNDDAPCIYVINAKKVAVETDAGTTNTLTVTSAFKEDGEENADAVIYSKDDLVLKGEGTLVIRSSDNAVRSNDDLKIKSGTYEIDCEKSAFKSHDAIEVEDGTITVNGCNDGFHAEDNDDDAKGSVLITGGTIAVTAADDAIHATATIQIDGGTLTLSGAEGIEATQITINGGDISIEATDDGINAAAKSSSLTPQFEMNGGNVVIKMGAGDTDGVDSNGNIYVNGGTLDITGQSTFDYDGEAKYTGGTIIENGQETNAITNQMMGGRGGFGFGGQTPNMQGGSFAPGQFSRGQRFMQ